MRVQQQKVKTKKKMMMMETIETFGRCLFLSLYLLMPEGFFDFFLSDC